MPAPTNPKKQSLMPSGALRKTLRAAGHHLDPIVQVGKEGVTDAVVRQLDEALLAHELVKVKVGTESPDDRFGVAEALSQLPGAFVAQVLGRTMLVYRKHPKKPKYEAGPPVVEDDAKPARRGARGRRPVGKRPAGKRPATRR